MKLKAFAVYDVKTGAYMRPFFSPARGMAVREFGDIAIDKSHPIGKHPEDYSLFEIGSFDDQNGMLVCHTANERVAHAMDFQAPREEPDLVDQAAKAVIWDEHERMVREQKANGGDV